MSPVKFFGSEGCDNISNFYVAHYKQKQIAVAIRKNRIVNEP